MDLFVLDHDLRRVELFDRYKSLIWTERFSAYGDFQFEILANRNTRKTFVPGTHLAINESTRVMMVETAKEIRTADGENYLQIKGPSFEDVLNDRTALDPTVLDEEDKKWYFEDMLPAEIARQIFEDICVTGILDPGDVFPMYTPGNLYPADTIPEPSDLVTLGIPPLTVYEAIKQVCDIYGLGFRVCRNGDESEVFFNVYAGNDRTTSQTTLPAVIFSSELDNLADVSYLTSISGYKNVAYVVGKYGSMVVYAPGTDPSVSGHDRRVLKVDATDITEPAGSTLDAMLTQRGLEQLALSTTFTAFDGQIPSNSQYRYHRDYELGDLIEMRNFDGVSNQMVVSEQIFVNDEQGYREYPTLAVKRLITPGSWAAEPTSEVWADLTSPTDTWESRP